MAVFIGVRCISSGATLRVVVFIRAHLVGCRGALWGSLGSFASTLAVVGFIQVRWVNPGTSLCSGVVGFIRVRLWDHLVHLVGLLD